MSTKPVIVVCCGSRPTPQLKNFFEKTFKAKRTNVLVKMLHFSPETFVEKVEMLFFMGDVCPWHSFYMMGSITKVQLDSVETLVKEKLPKNLANSVEYINPCEAILNSVKQSLISGIYVPEEYIVFDKVPSTEESNRRKRPAPSQLPAVKQEKKPKVADDVPLSQPKVDEAPPSQPKVDEAAPPPTSPPNFVKEAKAADPKEDIVSPEVATASLFAELEDGEIKEKAENIKMKIRKTLKDRKALTVQTEETQDGKNSPFDKNDSFIPLQTGTPKSRDLRDLIDKPLNAFYNESPSGKVSSRDQIDGIHRGGYVHPTFGVINFFWMREIYLDGSWVRPSSRFVKSIGNDLYLPWNSYFIETPSNIDFSNVIQIKMNGVPTFRFDKANRILFL